MRYGPGMQTGTSTFFFKLLKGPEFLQFFLLVLWITSASDNKCFFYTSFSYSFILFFFSTLHKHKEPPEETFFLAPFEVFPTLFPHMPALFSHDVFMGKYYFNNIKVLSHIKDHQGSQASLLLKTGTK